MSYPAGSCRGGEGRPAVLDSLSLVPHMSVHEFTLGSYFECPAIQSEGTHNGRGDARVTDAREAAQ